ncbi:MAG: MFS transporter [Ferruginibacter sp.]
MKKKTRSILPIIVIAQFLCTSLWFAGNAVLTDLAKDLNLNEAALGHITSAVQFGFIVGTLTYATLMIADRFSPSRVFFISAVLGALSNLGIVAGEQNITSLLALRFLTGFFLAGIYPVGMKIASDHFEKGLGKALGFLVGALVVGTAFPHLLKSFASALPWKMVLIFTSTLSAVGGILILLFVPNGPYQKKGQSLNFTALLSIFKTKPFRSAAFGYFGHMWELYTFWAFVPVILTTYKNMHPVENLNIPVLSFSIIAGGGLACIASGYLSQIFGVKKMAFLALFLSGCCCVISPLAFYLPVIPFLAFLIFWGLAVIADSPLFSTLVAQNATAEIKGTSLTIVTCIGFSITIVSIELLNYLSGYMNTRFIFLFLATGPLAGLLYLFRSKTKVEKA